MNMVRADAVQDTADQAMLNGVFASAAVLASGSTALPTRWQMDTLTTTHECPRTLNTINSLDALKWIALAVYEGTCLIVVPDSGFPAHMLSLAHTSLKAPLLGAHTVPQGVTASYTHIPCIR